MKYMSNKKYCGKCCGRCCKNNEHIHGSCAMGCGCPCHKPSVTEYKEEQNLHQDLADEEVKELMMMEEAIASAELASEPQSIPLGRDEREEKEYSTPLECRVCGYNHEPDCDKTESEEQPISPIVDNFLQESIDKESEEWEERFEQFGHEDTSDCSKNQCYCFMKYIKSFIKEILSSHTKKVVSELKEKIEGIPTYLYSDTHNSPQYMVMKKKDIINIINNIK